eukprot:CAMPEP_0179356868 /NCGR_PEP_ID=MMETSP0797-20121207/78111_1 /TAXON_ID=47934 /ORGANISM="Dinophysis acuminata, Strain DAEP01" /LENGTH=196 /DNA_ID=CAMNT_0021072061 /DNA_START=138 /DNA_END=725 /DNA_ORIENTATION=-
MHGNTCAWNSQQQRRAAVEPDFLIRRLGELPTSAAGCFRSKLAPVVTLRHLRVLHHARGLDAEGRLPRALRRRVKIHAEAHDEQQGAHQEGHPQHEAPPEPDNPPALVRPAEGEPQPERYVGDGRGPDDAHAPQDLAERPGPDLVEEDVEGDDREDPGREADDLLVATEVPAPAPPQGHERGGEGDAKGHRDRDAD